MFLCAGLVHFCIVAAVQLYFMRDLEKLLGWRRLGLVFFSAGVAGNLASAVFVPYRAEVGPSGAHFGVLAAFVVEVIKTREILARPWAALGQLAAVMAALLAVGLVPWVDNYAHAFGFVVGLLVAYVVLPDLDSTPIDRTVQLSTTGRKNLWKKIVSGACAATIFVVLVAVFYGHSFDCEICKLLSCVPIVSDFCAEQNINFEIRPYALA